VNLPGRRVCAACIAFLGSWLWAAASGAGTDYPVRPIRLLDSFSPGGGSDVLARIITPKLRDLLGQEWVVDNRSGAGGNLAVEILARAAPDGYTALTGVNTVLTVNPSLYKLPYSVEKDLQPVTLLATAQFILALHPSVPANTVKEFIALAKQKPGSLNYGSSGIGTPNHLAGELFKKQAGISMTHIPYKGGPPAVASLLAGEIQLAFASVASSMPYVKSARLKALATTGAQRSRVLPEVPTIAESGLPGFDVKSWYALLVPAKTPMSIVGQLHDAALKALELPDVQQALARQGLDIETSTPQELAARIRRESAAWAVVIEEAGIRAE
jgi:tripartite-type tricarboxylate transporter receptor subunit TctC